MESNHVKSIKLITKNYIFSMKLYIVLNRIDNIHCFLYIYMPKLFPFVSTSYLNVETLLATNQPCARSLIKILSQG